MVVAFDRFTQTVLRFRQLILVVWLLLMASAAVTYVARFSVDNSVEIWFQEGDPDLALYRNFTQRFGDREWIIVVVRGASIDNPVFRLDLATAVGRIETLPHIERVISIVEPGVAGLSLKDLLMRNGDERHTAILIESRDRAGAASVSWMATVDDIRAILERPDSFEAFWMAGTPIINAELNRAAQRDMVVFYCLIASLLFAFGLLFLGSWRDTVVLAAVVAGSVLPSLALAGATGTAFNMITLMLPTILVAMSSSLAIHTINEFHMSAEDLPVEAALETAVGALARPAFWSSVTTAIGFLALAQSQVAPIRQVGYLAALGICAGFLNTVVIAPVLLRILWKERRYRAFDRHRNLAAALIGGILVFRGRPATAITCATFLFAGCIAGLAGLRADTDYVDFFRDGRQLNKDYAAISAAGFPQDMFSLDLRIPHQPRDEMIPALVSQIGDLPVVDTVFPVLPPSRGSATISSGESYRSRLVFFTEHLSSNALEELRAQVSGIVRSAEPAGATGDLLGTNVLWSNMDKSVLQTQIRSVGLVFSFLLVLMPLLAGSLRVGIIGLLVSALPVFSVLGLMGWVGMTVNVATCLIGGVALGIATDDTIFFLTRVRRERRAGATLHGAITTALKTVGRAMIMTTSIMTLSFLSMGASDFLPTAQFGLFFSVVLISALLADLILLPSLLLLFDRHRQGRARE